MSDFYRKLSLVQKGDGVFGQIFMAPAPMVSDNTVAIRLGALAVGQDVKDVNLVGCRLDAKTFGSLAEAERVDIKKKMPMPELGLALNEELTIVKAKVRPVVLLFRDCYNHRRQANYLAGITGKPIQPNRHFFAPIFSLKKDTGDSDYPEKFIEMVKGGEFPNILYLPAFGRPIIYDSMLVLTDAFTASIKMVEPSEWCIDPLTLALKLCDLEEYQSGLATDLDEKLT